MLARIWRARPDPVEREADAVSFSLVTSLRGPSGPASVLVRRLSSTGFCAEAVARFARGTRVWINLPGIGEVGAVVAQSRGSGMIAEFTQPLDYRRCIEAVNRFEAA